MRLNLRHTWTTTMSSSQYRDTLYVAYARDGITGHGEGAPIVRYPRGCGKRAQGGGIGARAAALGQPMQFAKVMAEVFRCASVEFKLHEKLTSASPFRSGSQQAQNLFPSRRSRERHNDVAGHQHAQVTVHRLGRMQKQRRAPGRAERRRDLLRDECRSCPCR